MKPDLARLKRLRRLERVRYIAKQAAAAQAAEAEGTLAQLMRLSAQTDRLVGDYALQPGLSDAGDLRSIDTFVQQLLSLGAATAQEADRARAIADARQADLAQAERRRAAVEERALEQARKIESAKNSISLTARRGIGTGLE